MAPTHTIGGINYADVWYVALSIIGGLLILGGVATADYTEVAVARRDALAESAK